MSNNVSCHCCQMLLARRMLHMPERCCLGISQGIHVHTMTPAASAAAVKTHKTGSSCDELTTCIPSTPPGARAITMQMARGHETAAISWPRKQRLLLLLAGNRLADNREHMRQQRGLYNIRERCYQHIADFLLLRRQLAAAAVQLCSCAVASLPTAVAALVSTKLMVKSTLWSLRHHS